MAIFDSHATCGMTNRKTANYSFALFDEIYSISQAKFDCDLFEEISERNKGVWPLIESHSFKSSLQARLSSQLGIRFVPGTQPSYESEFPFSERDFLEVP